MKSGEKAKKRKVTLMLDEAVYRSVVEAHGSRSVGRYISETLRPLLGTKTLEEQYAAMAADDARANETADWEAIDHLHAWSERTYTR